MPKAEPYAVLVAGLHEAWDMEQNCLALLQPQLEAVPDNEAAGEALQRHICETQEQLRRLEAILCGLGKAARTTEL